MVLMFWFGGWGVGVLEGVPAKRPSLWAQKQFYVDCLRSQSVPSFKSNSNKSTITLFNLMTFTPTLMQILL